MKHRTIKLALICTAGGHFEQMTNLSDFYGRYDHFWVTQENKQTLGQLGDDRRYFIFAAHFKKPWTYMLQLPLFVKIFLKEKPSHILSTGSGRTALIPFLMVKYLKLKIEFIYIDTFSRVNGYSKLGSFFLKMGHPILSQWEDPGNEKVMYIGPVFKNNKMLSQNRGSEHIFVTVGMRSEPFTRLVKTVEDLSKKGVIKEKVIVQAGHTSYRSDQIEIFDFCIPEKIDELICNAKYVITQESAGIGTKCLRTGTKFLVMPRDYKYGELPAQSDMKEDLQFKLEEMGYTRVVNTASELESAIHSIDSLKSGFKFDNTLAIETLTRILDGTQ